MGYIIHIFLAVHVADIVGRKYLEKKAWLFGILLSIIMDIPSLWGDSLDIYEREHAHTWSHSLFAILLYCLIIMGLSFLRKKDPFSLVRIAIPVCSIHLLFDFLTTNGLPLFFPFSESLFGWDVISRYDIILSTSLCISIFFMYRFPRIVKSKYTLFFLLCYLLSSIGITLQAQTSVAPILSQMGFSTSHIHITSPSIIFPLRRICVKDENRRFAVAYFSPFSPRPPRVFVRETIENPQTMLLLQSDIGQRLLQISSSMIFMERLDNRYLFSDIRFGGFRDIWESPLRIQSILEKGLAHPLEHISFYSKTPLLDELQEGWHFVFP